VNNAQEIIHLVEKIEKSSGKKQGLPGEIILIRVNRRLDIIIKYKKIEKNIDIIHLEKDISRGRRFVFRGVKIPGCGGYGCSLAVSGPWEEELRQCAERMAKA